MNRTLVLISTVCVLLVCFGNTCSANPTNSQTFQVADRDYWPTQEWQTADPSVYDINTDYLDAMMTEIEESYMNIHSVIVIKNGYIVWEEYPRDIYDTTRLHMIQSCTKSFTSTLIGIALHEGFIDNVSQRMIDFFPDRTIANLDSRKESITLYNMLTMTEGMYWTELDYPYSDDRNTLRQMWLSSDAIQHILDQPMVREPGVDWSYNSGMPVLMGAILEQVTGMSVESFAEQYLFDKIGITDYQWDSMINSGALHTDGGLHLSSRDMAKLGYLMLNNGTWNGTEIVSADWVYDATHSDIPANSMTNYAYQWWVYNDYGFYAATGHYEQKIYIAPYEDVVAVFTANIADDQPHPTDRFMISYILPAVQGTTIFDVGASLDLLVNLGSVGVLAIPLVVFSLYYYKKMSK